MTFGIHYNSVDNLGIEDSMRNHLEVTGHRLSCDVIGVDDDTICTDRSSLHHQASFEVC